MCNHLYGLKQTCKVCGKHHDGWIADDGDHHIFPTMSPWRTPFFLSSVHLDQFLLAQVVAHQKRSHVLSLISLQLQDFAQFLVLHDGAVAAVLLFQGLEHLFQVVSSCQTLHGCQTLLAIPLLRTYVNVVLGTARVIRELGGIVKSRCRKRGHAKGSNVNVAHYQQRLLGLVVVWVGPSNVVESMWWNDALGMMLY